MDPQFNLSRALTVCLAPARFCRALIILSIAFLIATSSTGQPSKSHYPKALTILKRMEIGPASDAAVEKNRLYVIGSKSIYSFDVSSPENPVLLGQLSGLGNVR